MGARGNSTLFWRLERRAFVVPQDACLGDDGTVARLGPRIRGSVRPGPPARLISSCRAKNRVRPIGYRRDKCRPAAVERTPGEEVYDARFCPRNSLALAISESHIFSWSGVRKFVTRWRI